MRVGAELNSSVCRLVSRCTGDVSCSTGKRTPVRSRDSSSRHQ
jgi:hypothetical protein